MEALVVFSILSALCLSSATQIGQYDCETDPANTNLCLVRRYPDPFDCSQYFSCFDNCQSRLDQCDIGLHFSPFLQECIDQELSQCQVSTTPTFPTNPDPGPYDCPVDPENEGQCLSGRYPYPFDCSMYYACVTTCQSRLDTCNEGLEFSVVAQECVDPSISLCEVTPTSIVPSTPGEGPFECPVDPEIEGQCLSGRYPYPFDCSMYYACITTCQFRLDTCSEGLEFSVVVEECVDPSISLCEVSTPSLAPTSTITPITEPDRGPYDCPADPENEGQCLSRRYPYPFDCSMYYACVTTCQSRLDTCTEGLEFSVVAQECVDPSISACEVSTTSITPPSTIVPSTDPDLGPYDCPVDPENEGQCLSGRYPYPFDCSMYYACITTCQSRLDTCPEGLEFSVVAQECVDPSISDCEVSTTSITPPSTLVPSTNPDLGPYDCPVDPENEGQCLSGRYPYPFDCSMYYACVTTCQSRLDTCPEGLEFSEIAEECVDPSISFCEVSTTTVSTTTSIPSTPTTPSTPSTPTTPSTLPPSPFDCLEDPDNEGLCIPRRYPHPSDCSLYYTCFENCLSREDTCPEGLEFSDRIQECVNPALSNCSITTTVSTTESSTVTTTGTTSPTTPTTQPQTTVQVTTVKPTTQQQTTQPQTTIKVTTTAQTTQQQTTTQPQTTAQVTTTAPTTQEQTTQPQTTGQVTATEPTSVVTTEQVTGTIVVSTEQEVTTTDATTEQEVVSTVAPTEQEPVTTEQDIVTTDVTTEEDQVTFIISTEQTEAATDLTTEQDELTTVISTEEAGITTEAITEQDPDVTTDLELVTADATTEQDEVPTDVVTEQTTTDQEPITPEVNTEPDVVTTDVTAEDDTAEPITDALTQIATETTTSTPIDVTTDSIVTEEPEEPSVCRPHGPDDPDIPGVPNDCVQERLPYPTDCSFYYTCFFNCSYRVTPCPEGLEYSAIRKECVEASVAECVASTLAVQKTTIAAKSWKNDFNNLEGDDYCEHITDSTCQVGKFAVPFDSTQFVTCFSECDQIIEQCPSGTYYNPFQKMCI